MDPNDPLATPDQSAVDAQLQSYNSALAQLQGVEKSYADVFNDPNASSTKLNDAAKLVDNARAQVSKAASDYGNTLTKLALSREATARAAKDPDEKRLWLAKADDANAQKDLYAAEAGLYGAKTQAEMDRWSQTAQAALQNAQSRAGRVTSQNDLDSGRALLARNKAADIGALDASTIALHTAQIGLAGARAQKAIADAGLSTAKTNILIPAEAQKYVSQGLLSQAQAEQLQRIGPVRVDALEAKLGLDKTRADALRAQIGKQQVLPSSLRNEPNLTVFQPLTGQITSQPNPSYVNPYLQPLSDRAAAIEAIKNDLAAGKFGTGPEAMDYANQLIAGVSQAALLQAQGYTPEQYQQAVQKQAEFGQGILGGIQKQGQGMADTMLQYASKARGLGGFNASPFANAIGMAGGPDILNKALSLIAQIQPITDRTSAVDALSKYAAAKSIMAPATDTGAAPDQTAAPTAPGMGGGPYQGAPNPNIFGSGTGNVPTPAPPTPFVQSDIPEGTARTRFLSGALAGAQ